MKKLLFVLVFVFLLFSSAFAQTNRWTIERDGDEIRMRNRYDPDPLKRYKGTIDKDGSVRMRDYQGNRLRGNIDIDGYGKLRDDYGNTFRVKPK
jgi:hypothetical protein